MAVATFLMIFRARVTFLFIVKVKIRYGLRSDQVGPLNYVENYI